MKIDETTAVVEEVEIIGVLVEVSVQALMTSLFISGHLQVPLSLLKVVIGDSNIIEV